MKIAYRIITPILAIGAVVMGFFLKLFYFALGGLTDEISSIVTLASQFGVSTKYEFSAFEIIKLLLTTDLSGAATDASKESASFMTIIQPVLPHIIAFIVFFVLTMLLFLALGAVAAATGKRKTVMIMSAGGLVLCFICIIISRLAFNKIIGGEIPLTDLVSMFSDSTWMQLLTAVVTVSSATLSAGFYAVFGMHILVILWTVLTNMLINTPIEIHRKHRRKKPMKKLSAVFRK
ncbi:MAG: hypothetical protein IJB74_10075 [Clostridia bacterium]|nr:hypothetical protein [Clostridia bacterium]